MKKFTLISLITACSLYAAGYKVPEASVNSVALSGATIAHNTNADTALFNPANMAFMENGSKIEVDLMYIGLSATNFKGTASTSGSTVYDIDAQSEIFFVPSIHYVSEDISGFRFGFSLFSPGGLTKRWSVSPAKDTAEEFSLQVVELNPTVALKLSNEISAAIGVRLLYSSGVVKSDGTLKRDMEGDSTDYAYNFALSYKPTNNLEFGLTYRSEVSLTQEGTAKLYGADKALDYHGGSTVCVPLPASVSLAFAYTLPSKTTVEFVYEKNYWSAYETLDFDYAASIGNLTPYFDDPIAKDWKDTNAYRLGITQELDEMTLMVGVVKDETPIPDESLSFELPDSDALAISSGVRYQIDKDLSAGLSALYSMKETRETTNDDLSGEFSNSNGLLISTGVEYKF